MCLHTPWERSSFNRTMVSWHDLCSRALLHQHPSLLQLRCGSAHPPPAATLLLAVLLAAPHLSAQSKCDSSSDDVLRAQTKLSPRALHLPSTGTPSRGEAQGLHPSSSCPTVHKRFQLSTFIASRTCDVQRPPGRQQSPWCLYHALTARSTHLRCGETAQTHQSHRQHRHSRQGGQERLKQDTGMVIWALPAIPQCPHTYSSSPGVPHSLCPPD